MGDFTQPGVLHCSVSGAVSYTTEPAFTNPQKITLSACSFAGFFSFGVFFGCRCAVQLDVHLQYFCLAILCLLLLRKLCNASACWWFQEAGLCSARQFWCFWLLLRERLGSSAFLSEPGTPSKPCCKRRAVCFQPLFLTALWPFSSLFALRCCMSLFTQSMHALEACTGTHRGSCEKDRPISDLRFGSKCSKSNRSYILKTLHESLIYDFQGTLLVFKLSSCFITTTRHWSAILYWFTALWSAIDHYLGSASEAVAGVNHIHKPTYRRQQMPWLAGKCWSDIKACMPKAKGVCSCDLSNWLWELSPSARNAVARPLSVFMDSIDVHIIMLAEIIHTQKSPCSSNVMGNTLFSLKHRKAFTKEPVIPFFFDLETEACRG